MTLARHISMTCICHTVIGPHTLSHMLKCVAVNSLNFVPAWHQTTLACHASYLDCSARLACKRNCLSSRGHAVCCTDYMQSPCVVPARDYVVQKRVCVQNSRRCC